MTLGHIVMFAGPSLPPDARPCDARLEWLPPAEAGDLLRLLDCPPDAICLIDGFFGRRPAPWHKEIMMLMARGVAVFGAASMGALRAAELRDYGMIGVGVIFNAYRRGLLTGDDEVACVHAPVDLGWAALTVPMVEVRATLAAAVRIRVIDSEIARSLRALAHNIHFDARDWAAMERVSVASGVVTPARFDRLRRLHVPLKRMDALVCLSLAAGWSEAPARCVPPPRTCYLDALDREVRAATARSASTSAMNVAPAFAAKG